MTKGQLATLWGLGVGVVSVFAILAYVLLRPSQPALRLAEPPRPPDVAFPARSYSLPQTPYSARTLYRQAEGAAREWQPDHRL